MSVKTVEDGFRERLDNRSGPELLQIGLELGQYPMRYMREIFGEAQYPCSEESWSLTPGSEVRILPINWETWIQTGEDGVIVNAYPGDRAMGDDYMSFGALPSKHWEDYYMIEKDKFIAGVEGLDGVNAKVQDEETIGGRVDLQVSYRGCNIEIRSISERDFGALTLILDPDTDPNAQFEVFEEFRDKIFKLTHGDFGYQLKEGFADELKRAFQEIVDKTRNRITDEQLAYYFGTESIYRRLFADAVEDYKTEFETLNSERKEALAGDDGLSISEPLDFSVILDYDFEFQPYLSPANVAKYTKMLAVPLEATGMTEPIVKIHYVSAVKNGEEFDLLTANNVVLGSSLDHETSIGSTHHNVYETMERRKEEGFSYPDFDSAMIRVIVYETADRKRLALVDMEPDDPSYEGLVATFRHKYHMKIPNSKEVTQIMSDIVSRNLAGPHARIDYLYKLLDMGVIERDEIAKIMVRSRTSGERMDSAQIDELINNSSQPQTVRDYLRRRLYLMSGLPTDDL